MNRLRDIIYNTSDILVTLLIIAAALLIIAWRVSAIMDYSSADDDVSGQTTSQTVSEDASVSEDDGGSSEENTDDDGSTAASGDVSFTVSQNQTADTIAESLVSAGLITDKKSFITAVNNAGAATRLKTGTFTIPAGSTPEQIVTILTS